MNTKIVHQFDFKIGGFKRSKCLDWLQKIFFHNQLRQAQYTNFVQICNMKLLCEMNESKLSTSCMSVYLTKVA